MRDLLISSVVLICSSIIILSFRFFNLPPEFIHRIMVVLLMLIILIISSLRIKVFENFFISQGRWYLLLIGTVLMELIIFATGGMSSPFFILVHLFILGVSLFLSFQIAILFLLSVVSVFIASSIIDRQFYDSLLSDPTAALLYLVTFIAIIPLSKVITDQYKSKERFSKILENEINVEESILENLNELVVVTDTKMRILSINDAVEQTLRKTRGELLYKPLFEVMYLRDSSGNLVTKESLYSEKDSLNEKKTMSDLRLPTTTSVLKVDFLSKPIMNIEGKVDQISVILNPINSSKSTEHNNLDEVKARYVASIESLKHRLSEKGLIDLHNQLLLIKKADNDIEFVHTFEDHSINEKRALTDIAALSREIVYEEKELAEALKVGLDFKLVDFGEKDIAHMIHKSVPVTPDQLTGPFFTAECDIKLLELIIEKLLDISMLLSSSEDPAKVVVSIKREGNKSLILKISSSCNFIHSDEYEALFTHNYKGIQTKKNLALGSGLEGYLASTVAKHINIPIETIQEPETSYLSFVLTIPKNIKSVSAQ